MGIIPAAMIAFVYGSGTHTHSCPRTLTVVAVTRTKGFDDIDPMVNRREARATATLESLDTSG